MKKVVFTLSAIVAFTFGVHAQTGTAAKAATTTKSTTATKENAAPAKDATISTTAKGEAGTDFVKYSKTLNDYGTIKKGADGNCEFVFKNTSTAPLVITSCYGSCGCTVPNWPKEPLMPGKTASIKVHYDTNRTGPFEKTVTVNYQDHSEPIVLKIKGTVETPPADVPFGSQPANTGAPLERNN